MRIRFEFQSLYSLGAGVHRLPIKCWRFTFNYIDGNGTVVLDGTLYGNDLVDPNTGDALGPAQFVAGGVIMPDGTPVNLDQVLFVSVANNNAQGMLMYEYLEP